MLPAALAELKVIELAGGIAAAYAGKMLRDAGAAVTLAEPPGGSPLRRRHALSAMGLAPPLGEGETSALFRYLARGKRNAALLDGDVDALVALCGDADLLIADDPDAERSGMLDRLRVALPGLSIVMISNWGDGGPMAATPATEFTLQAETGSLAARGYADRPPVGTGGNLGDYIAGTFAAVAALVAWRDARRDGRGRQIDLSRFEAMLTCLQSYQYIHGELEPGALLPTSIDVPSIEPARDGWVGYATITDAQWRSFAAMIGHAALGEDETLRYANQRFAALDRLRPLITAYTSARTVEELVREATERRIPVVPLGEPRTVLDMDHFSARGVFRRIEDGYLEPRPPYLISEAAPSPPPPEEDTPAPLERVRVLDLSAFWAGPMAGVLLAALGADVLKVESIQRPDGMRYAAGFVPPDKPIWECSPIYLGANSGKRGITLDLTRPAGLALLKRLIADSDVLIENFSPRVMEAFGLSWEAVRAINPRIVMLRMPAFGLDGPWRDRTGFAMTMEQVSGMAALTGYPDRPPMPPRGCVDPIGGVNGVFATLCALELRSQDGAGRLVEAPLAEAGIAVSAEAVVDLQAYGEHQQRSGNSGPDAVPQGVLRCADGELIAISVADDAQWRALVDATGVATLDDPSFCNARGRRAAEPAILAELTRWCETRTSAAAVERLSAAGVPAAPLRNARTLHAHPQLDARGFYTRLDHAVAGSIGFPNPPFRIDGRYPRPDRPAPLLGEHNHEVLRGRLGLDHAAIEALARDGIIGTRPAQ